MPLKLKKSMKLKNSAREQAREPLAPILKRHRQLLKTNFWGYFDNENANFSLWLSLHTINSFAPL